MTPEDWTALQTAFEEALELSEPERSRFVRAQFSDNPALKEEFDRLIAVSDDDDGSLLEPVAAAAAALVDTDTDPWVGKQFGSYEATKRIATGGMSAVYLGRRTDDEFDQNVAIKIVAGSILSEELQRRFKIERQILASLQHPFVAQLFDGGTTSDGMPYFVMEYVEGLPIDEYCDKNILSIDDRLELFRKVCTAVDYAHRNLVVHRDIKPSNIIVANDGTPKLLDFGIAKPLDQAALKQTIAMTRADMRAMTPEYASPEQVRGEQVTTATDVYSLGVLLYKLLSGHMPYLLQSNSVAAVAKVICETIPSRPSTMIDGEVDQTPRIVALRGTTVSKLQKTLTGDLDNIVLATLHKDPERRYPSSRALSEDIARYRAHEPIHARPDSLTYRTRKFLSRHRLGVTAASIVILVISGLVTFYTLQVTDERNRAEAQARKAEEVVEFLTGVFGSASPFYSKGVEPSVKELLAGGVEQIENNLVEQPEIQADLLLRLAIIQQDLGFYEEAWPLLDRSIELQNELYGQNHPNVVPALLNKASALRFTDQKTEAIALAEEILALPLPPGDVTTRQFASAYHTIGNAYFDIGDDSASIQSLTEARALFGVLRPERDNEYAQVLNDLALPHLFIGDYETSEALILESLGLLRKVHGDMHPTIVIGMQALANINSRLGRLAEAEAIFLETVDVSRNLYGYDHPDYAATLGNVGNFYSSTQDWVQTERFLDEALEIFMATLGEDHSQTTKTLGALSEVYAETGRIEEALPIAEAALEAARRQSGPRSRGAAIAAAEYADALLEAYEDEAAAETFAASVEVFAEQEDGMGLAYTQAKWGRSLIALNRIPEAERAIGEAVKFVRSGTDLPPGVAARILIAAGELALAKDEIGGAQQLSEEALAIASQGPQNTWYWLARLVQANASFAAGDTEIARESVQTIISGLSRENGTRSRAEEMARELLVRIESSTAN